MFYEMEIAGLKRKLPLFKVDKETQIAAFIIFGDVEMTEAAARELLKKAPEFDILMTAEAKSVPLIYEMAKQAGQDDYIIARKGVKVYMTDPISVKVNSITTHGQQYLHLGQEEIARIKGKKVLIVDDVISTGESLQALENLATQAGANIVGKMAILGEGDSIDREDITVLAPLPVFDAEGNPK